MPTISAVLALTLILPAPVSAPATTIASGLDNPRGLAFATDGTLYVAESGTGGTGPCFPGEVADVVCLGSTGAVTEISRGRQRRVMTGLPSIAAVNGSRAIGPSDVAVAAGTRLVVTAGLAVLPAARDELPAAGQDAGWLLGSSRRGVTRIADIAGYAARTDPDGGNPNSVVLTTQGAVVADAAGNTLIRVARDGTASTLATFPSQLADAPPSTGMPPGTKIPVQAVPTSVVVGPDGAFYVGQLTGFPYPLDRASVFRVVPGQQPTVVAGGFTTIADLAFDRRGSLYVLEMARNGLLSGDPTGALIKVRRDGTHQTLTTNLIHPGGLVIRNHVAYVTDCGTCPGAGTVQRIPLP